MTRTKRWLLAVAGILLVGIGALGVVLPGLPTTVFLLGASWCFTRSCPWLEERILRTRFFRPYLRYLDADTPMPTRARVITIAIIWTAVSFSLFTLDTQHLLTAWSGAPIVAAALVGSVVVWRFRRAVPARETVDPAVSESE